MLLIEPLAEDTVRQSPIDPKVRLDMGAADATLNQGMGLTLEEDIIGASALDPFCSLWQGGSFLHHKKHHWT